MQGRGNTSQCGCGRGCSSNGTPEFRGMLLLAIKNCDSAQIRRLAAHSPCSGVDMTSLPIEQVLEARETSEQIRRLRELDRAKSCGLSRARKLEISASRALQSRHMSHLRHPPPRGADTGVLAFLTYRLGTAERAVDDVARALLETDRFHFSGEKAQRAARRAICNGQFQLVSLLCGKYSQEFNQDFFDKSIPISAWTGHAGSFRVLVYVALDHHRLSEGILSEAAVSCLLCWAESGLRDPRRTLEVLVKVMETVLNCGQQLTPPFSGPALPEQIWQVLSRLATDSNPRESWKRRVSALLQRRIATAASPTTACRSPQPSQPQFSCRVSGCERNFPDLSTCQGHELQCCGF